MIKYHQPSNSKIYHCFIKRRNYKNHLAPVSSPLFPKNRQPHLFMNSFTGYLYYTVQHLSNEMNNESTPPLLSPTQVVSPDFEGSILAPPSLGSRCIVTCQI